MTDISYQLVVRKGPQPGQVFPLSLQSISIGRDPMSDITLIDPEVSRYHAQLLLTEDGFQIQDMGSTNGTFIDGEHLGGQPALLTPGQKVQLGSGVVLDFEVVVEGDDARVTVADVSPSPPSGETEMADEPIAEAGDYDGPAAVEVEPEPVPPLQDFEPPRPSSPAPGPLVAPGEDPEPARRRRRTIIIVSIILLLCCCCAFFLSGYYIWGDPLLKLLLDLGLMNWLRDLGVSI